MLHLGNMRALLLFFIFRALAASGDLFAQCPYCDPNYVDVPNLQSAMQGYDLPMGDPNSNIS